MTSDFRYRVEKMKKIITIYSDKAECTLVKYSWSSCKRLTAILEDPATLTVHYTVVYLNL